MEIGELLQYYMLNTVINFLFKNFIALWRHLAKTQLLSFIHTVHNRFEHHTVAVFSLNDEIFKQKVNDCVQHIILQKFTNFHAIQSWNFQNICNEIGLWRQVLVHWATVHDSYNGVHVAQYWYCAVPLLERSQVAVTNCVCFSLVQSNSNLIG